ASNDDPNRYAPSSDPDGTASGQPKAECTSGDQTTPYYPIHGFDITSWPHYNDAMGQTSMFGHTPRHFDHNFATGQGLAPPFAGTEVRPTELSFASGTLGSIFDQCQPPDLSPTSATWMPTQEDSTFELQQMVSLPVITYDPNLHLRPYHTLAPAHNHQVQTDVAKSSWPSA
ncbi:hypothetical protein BKA62DRAFT_288406, partial [Auriculariales sp. MPI-PUGE-AT-0066]